MPNYLVWVRRYTATRGIKVEAQDEEEARQKVLAELAKGCEVVEVSVES